MPLYEAAGFRTRGKSSNYKPLTKAQKHEALCALFGPIDPPMTSQITPQISAEDIERMRTLVAQADSANKNENREFDLNNPPKKQYIHQAWPCAVYHHKTQRVKPAKNEAELAEALKHGWVKESFTAETGVEAVELDEQDKAELKAVEATLKLAKRKAAADAKARK